MTTERQDTQKPLLSRLTVGILLAAASQITLADSNRTSELEEVLVTAQKREQSLQSVPLAISALTALQLEAQGISSFDELSDGAIPSLRILPFGNSPSTKVITIRGNGPLDVGQVTRDGSVALYLDGIYLGRAQGLSMEYAELKRIEVLRGPQGTLFGRNTTGGAVSLISQKPSGSLGLKQTVGTGRYDALRSSTHFNLPEFAGLSIKLDYLHSERDGWVDNTAPGQSDYNAYDKDGGRVSLRWQPTEPWLIDYTYDRSDVDVTQNYFQLHEDLIGAIGVEPGRQKKTRFPVNTLDPTTTKQDMHALTASWEWSDNLTLKSLTAYHELDEETNNNFAGALYFNGLIAASDIQQQQFSQELQLIGSSEQLEWVAGLYYFEEDVDETLLNLFTLDIFGDITGTPLTQIPPLSGAPPRVVSARTKSTAVYGQATWTPPILQDRLHITVGARYTEDDKSGQRFETGFDRFSLDSNNVDPLVTLSYDWTDSLSSYIKWSSAYKTGGVNSRAASFSAYKPEEVDTLELGLKSEWWNRRLRLNAAVFATDFEDMQFDVADPTNIAIAETINGPNKVEVDGLELDLTLAPLAGLTLNLSYTYLDGDMPLQPNPLTNGALELFDIAQTPQHAGSFSASYTFAPGRYGTFIAHTDITSTDHYAYVAFGDDRKDAYTLLNGRLSLVDINLGQKTGTFKVSVWGKNLTDEEYIVFALPLGGLAVTQVYGTPRTAGIEITYAF